MDFALKANLFVRAVAERLIGGMATAAKRDGSAPGEPKRIPLLILDFEITIDAQRTIIRRYYFRRRHAILRSGTRFYFAKHSACRDEFITLLTNRSGDAIQYLGTEGSTSSDHARIPPLRFQILRKPARRRNSTASAERLPLRQ